MQTQVEKPSILESDAKRDAIYQELNQIILKWPKLSAQVHADALTLIKSGR
jgi:hypothetical protein